MGATEHPRTGDHAGGGGEAARLGRVEEGLAFTDRTVEQLSEEMAELHKRVRDLTRKLGAMEERLGKMLARVEEGVDDAGAAGDGSGGG